MKEAIKTIKKVSEIDKSYSQTVRGLTETGYAAIAIAVGTGGLGSGISGAMMTAAATTGATTTTVAATNSSMNSDGDIFKQIKDINKDAWDASTSRDSFENYAIASVIAAAGYGIGEWMKAEGVEPGFEMGNIDDSKIGINVEQHADGSWYKTLPTGQTQKISSFEAHAVGNQNPGFKLLNKTPGAPPFAGFHDAMNFPIVINQVSIAPFYAMSQCAAAPTLCAAFPDTFIKIGTWGQVDTNLDINKNNHE